MFSTAPSSFSSLEMFYQLYTLGDQWSHDLYNSNKFRILLMIMMMMMMMMMMVFVNITK